MNTFLREQKIEVWIEGYIVTGESSKWTERNA